MVILTGYVRRSGSSVAVIDVACGGSSSSTFGRKKCQHKEIDRWQHKREHRRSFRFFDQ